MPWCSRRRRCAIWRRRWARARSCSAPIIRSRGRSTRSTTCSPRPRSRMTKRSRSSAAMPRACSAWTPADIRPHGATREAMPHDVHLVGSVPLTNAEEVFATISAALGPRLKRIPDGETGARSDWITWLEPEFADNPALEKSDQVFRLHAQGTPRVRYRLKPGRSIDDVRFANLHYADIAKESYAVFHRLKAAGKIAAATRFQVDLVPAHSVLWLFLVDELTAAVDPI